MAPSTQQFLGPCLVSLRLRWQLHVLFLLSSLDLLPLSLMHWRLLFIIRVVVRFEAGVGRVSNGVLLVHEVLRAEILIRMMILRTMWKGDASDF